MADLELLALRLAMVAGWDRRAGWLDFVERSAAAMAAIEWVMRVMKSEKKLPNFFELPKKSHFVSRLAGRLADWAQSPEPSQIPAPRAH